MERALFGPDSIAIYRFGFWRLNMANGQGAGGDQFYSFPIYCSPEYTAFSAYPGYAGNSLPETLGMPGRAARNEVRL